MARSLVPFLATREAVAPLANDPIMSGTSIWSFRQLEQQNLSSKAEMIFNFIFGHQGGRGTTWK